MQHCSPTLPTPQTEASNVCWPDELWWCMWCKAEEVRWWGFSEPWWCRVSECEFSCWCVWCMVSEAWWCVVSEAWWCVVSEAWWCGAEEDRWCGVLEASRVSLSWGTEDREEACGCGVEEGPFAPDGKAA